MTDFQKKRLDYLIKAASKSEWVQLAKGDIEMLEVQKDLYERICNIYWKGWEDCELKVKQDVESE